MLPRSHWLRALTLSAALAFLTGCGSGSETVTPVAADQAPTSDMPVGKEPTLPGDDEGVAPTGPGAGEPAIDDR